MWNGITPRPPPPVVTVEQRPPSLASEIGGFVLLALGTVIVVGLLLCCSVAVMLVSLDPCGTRTDNAHPPSPDDRYRVSVETSDCGALGWGPTWISVLDAQQDRRATLVRLELSCGDVTVSWMSDTEMTLLVDASPDPDDRPIPYTTTWHDLTIYVQ